MAAPSNTSSPKIVVAHGGWGRQNWDVIEQALKEVGGELHLRNWQTEDEFVAAAHDAIGLVQGGPVRLTSAVMDRLPNLQFVAAQGIGVDFTDIPDATKHGIVIINLPGVIHREVAAHTWSLILALVRHVGAYHQGMRDNTRYQPAFVHHLYGETIGIVSYGNIGKLIARQAKGFEMRVIAFDPFVTKEQMAKDGVEHVSLNQLFRESDIVSCHVPLNAETYHLIGEEQFRLMKRHAYFVNNGRGKVVDEPALIRALQEGWVAAAALDVLEQEPPDRSNPLLTMANVVLTPHVASVSNHANVERRKQLAVELALSVSGHWPRFGLVNKDVKPKVPLTPAPA